MLRDLKRFSSNFWFEWNDNVKALLYRLSPDLWALAHRNPYRFLKLIKENSIATRLRFFEFMSNPENAALYEKVKHDFETYMNPSSTLVAEKYPTLKNKQIAYFSMEFGVDILRTYSGGLGILSGDHVRGASDMGLNLVGVGLFYFHGYYQQMVNSGGEMLIRYRTAVPLGRPLRDYLPLEPVKKKGTRRNLIISVPLHESKVFTKVWRARIGRNEILLLDTNTPENKLRDRNITYRLYQAEREHETERKRRLEQEIVLGIGGVRALQEAGYTPDFYHLNEGHVAFAGIEIIHQKMKEKQLNFQNAKKEAAKKIGFTTHTSVPEGNERFHEGMVRHFLSPYLDSFLEADSRDLIFNCARNENDEFDMTKFSLLLSGGFRNGVSELHGEVCRKMWSYAWGISEEHANTTPIGSITNGVHVPYWQAPEVRALIEKAGGLDHFQSASDEALWEAHQTRKGKLIQKVLEKRRDQLIREQFPWRDIKEEARIFEKEKHDLISPDSFVIGYARRFAGYKRAGFFLEDEDMFFNFLKETYQKYGKPVTVLYAGKPHPSGADGIATIRTIYEVSKRLSEKKRAENFKATLLFVDGYNIELARRLISGTDIWLNNPIRPLEASGTSGMKAGMNGVLNVSIPDGWIPEGITQGKNGWLFGSGEAEKGEADRAALYRLLREEILPIYFDRPEGLAYSPRWMQLMKASIQDLTRQFGMTRMLSEYIEKMYLPAIKPHKSHSGDKAHSKKGSEEIPV